MRHVRQTVASALLVGSLAIGAVGCASDRYEGIPNSARMTSEGDKRLSYEAPSDGNIFVYDEEADRMVYSGTIDKGQTIVVDPDDDKVVLDGRPAVEQGLNSGNRHRIFFEPKTKPDVDVEVRTTETTIQTETEMD